MMIDCKLRSVWEMNNESLDNEPYANTAHGVSKELRRETGLESQTDSVDVGHKPQTRRLCKDQCSDLRTHV